jgi:hypothetical protein
MTSHRPCLQWDVVPYGDVKLGIAAPEDHHRMLAGVLGDGAWRTQPLVPYCQDFANAQLLYASDVDPLTAAQATFHHGHLRQHMRRMVSVPWEVRLAEGLRGAAQPAPVFVFSPGRCGSTLLSKVVGALGAVSLSEPDFYTQVVRQALRYRINGMNPQPASALLRCLTDDLLAPLQQRPGVPAVIKLRADANGYPHALLSSIAGRPRTLFIIRHFHSWATSMWTAFHQPPERCLTFYTAALASYRYLRQHSDCLLLQYEDLTADNHALVSRLAGFLSLTPPAAPLATFAVDAQAGTRVARDARKHVLTDEVRIQIPLLWRTAQPSALIDELGLAHLKRGQPSPA